MINSTKILLVLLSIITSITLAGCAITSGESAYTLEPVITGSGETICCKVVVNNTKDYDRFSFKLKKKKDGSLEVTLDEKGVSASDPNAVAAENNGKLLDAVKAIIPVMSVKQ